MEERGLSQFQLSKAARVPDASIKSWLAGKTLPHYKSIQQLCRFLKVDASVFFD